MAIPWLTLLKTVPWTEVIANAPLVANGAKKLWSSVSGHSPAVEAPSSAHVAPPSENQAIAALHEELHALRISTAELHQQMLASSELITELAEQNAALIKRVEAYRVRLMGLSVAVALLAVLALASLGLVLGR